MGYSWYRVDSAFVRHPKTLKLKAELNEPLADAYVNRLWAWTQLYAPGGRFDAALVAGLESELLWTGSPGSLAAALEKTGWLERIGEQFEVHDWSDFQGFHVRKSKKDADKKRKRRARASARTASGQNADRTAPSPRTAPPTDVTDGRTDGRNVVEEKPPPASPKPLANVTPAEAFWGWANDRRRAEKHPGEPMPRDLSGWWSGVLMEINGDEARARRAFEFFLADEHWRANGCPFAAFRKQWAKYASDHYGKSQPKGAAPASATDWSDYKPGDTARELGMDPEP